MSPAFEHIHPDAKPGYISLTVPDLDRSIQFYQGVFGLMVKSRQGDTYQLGSDGGETILELVGDPSARPALGTTGLYHFAILLPSRQDLALALQHLLEVGWPLQGAADHLVSEALYLEDPDGNEIEIYRDRPRDSWKFQNGHLQMATLPLDVDSLLAEPASGGIAGGRAWAGMPAGTVLGHVHLKVADISQAEAFYCDLLGFDRVTRYGASAGFVSAGGYHHHIGFNTWESAGAPPPPPGAAGLRYFTIVLPEAEDLTAIERRLEEAAYPFLASDGGIMVRDPAQNSLLLGVGNNLS